MLINFSWQGIESRNITFTDELEFDPKELDIVYADDLLLTTS